MAIDLHCACGKSYAVTDDKAGKRIRCPHCQSIMMVPLPEVGMGRATAISPPEMIPPPNAPSSVPTQATVIPPPAVSPTYSWFYTRNGQPQGPVDESWLIQMIRTGQLSTSELAWKNGDSESKPIASIPMLMSSSIPPGAGIPPPASASDVNIAVLIAGYVLAVLIPIIGLGIGIYALVKKSTANGVAITAISLLAMGFYFLLAMAG